MLKIDKIIEAIREMKIDTISSDIVEVKFEYLLEMVEHIGLSNKTILRLVDEKTELEKALVNMDNKIKKAEMNMDLLNSIAKRKKNLEEYIK